MQIRKPLTALLLASTLFILNGCENKSSQETPAKENTLTEEVSENTETSYLSQLTDTVQKSLPFSEEKAAKPVVKKEAPLPTISGINGTKVPYLLKNGKLEIKTEKPLLMVNLFDWHSSASLSQLQYLETLQNRYSESLLVLSLQRNASHYDADTEALMQRYNLSYLVSNSASNQAIIDYYLSQPRYKESNTSAPLTILFKEGAYQTHYEGAVPVEMLNFDILRLLKEK